MPGVLHVTVLDTLEPGAAIPLPVEAKIIQEETVPSAPPPETVGTDLSHFISRKSIVIWDTPIAKDNLLQSLTEAIRCENGIEQRLKGLDAVREREEQGSTFFNEGVAFPHARIEGLKRSCVAIGLTHRGVPDVETEKPIECVFLIFSPADIPDEQLQILALVSKAAQDRHLMDNLRSAKTPAEVYTAIQNWEAAL